MNPLDELGKEASKRFFGRIFDDVLGYLRVYDYVKLKAADLTGKSKRVTVDSFWFSILGDKFAHKIDRVFTPLKNGDVIKLKDVFITEWAPKLPGQLWTSQGVMDLVEGQSHIDRVHQLRSGAFTAVLTPEGKEKSISAGFGSVRIKPDPRDEQYCTYLGLVDAKNWHSDYAIPLVVSRSVYKEFRKYSEDGAPWIEEIEGILCFHEDIPLKSFIPRAIGATLSPETEETLRYRPNLPKSFIYVSSPLSLKLRYNDSQPVITAWTMFETNKKNSPYRYTYVLFDPSTEDNFEEATEFLKWYVRQYGVSLPNKKNHTLRATKKYP